MSNLSSRRARIIIRVVAILAITLILLITSACATPPTAVAVQPSPTNTFTPQPSETPTATPTLTPTRTPLPTITPTPDWEKFNPTTWEECASKAHPAAQYAMMKAYNDFAKTHDIATEVAKFKASGKYEKPSFQSMGSMGSSAGGFAFGYLAYTRDAIYLGSSECTLQNISFGISNNVDVKVTIYLFVPVDAPDKLIMTIGKFTYPDPGLRSGKGLFGVREVMPEAGQIFRLRQAVGMSQVDVYRDGKAVGVSLVPGDTNYIGKTGESLATQLGMLSSAEAKKILGPQGTPGVQGPYGYGDEHAERLREHIDSKNINLLVGMIIKR